MKITHLSKNYLYEAMAKECNFDKENADCWHEQIGIGCPFEPDDDGRGLCKSIKPEHWRDVFECEDKLGSEFRFGDKVTHYVDFPVRAIFSAYKESRHSGEAYLLFDGDPECQVVSVCNVKAGWA